MKVCLLTLAVMTALLSPTRICRAGGPDEAPQFVIQQGETKVAELSLKPGEKKPIVIVTDKALMVGLKTDLGMQVVNGYIKSGQKAAPMITDSDDATWVGSLIGAGENFSPKNGEISLVASNPLDRPVRLLVYTEPALTGS